ncbi:receptor-type tyrosine-protein phosphatase eta-like isoform X2 [Phymastichus coffea]|uniref:receptor-type tyrosine-protein phosphatase eta-like isoform X2 n=1 Tax=Phymastichus coffea TaxID=108790 RepID=UPI00273B6DE2|nr:receptor-type tyrosine-protein phosphatase eta-like isoform X2 [Phymastichus coffea]
MMPRRRLQLLLHVLQMFCVFGDGDPGGGDDLVGPTAATGSPSLDFTSLLDRSTKASDRDDNHLHAYSTPATFDDLANQIDTVVESVSVVNLTASSLTLIWNVSGPSDTDFIVSLYAEEALLQNYTTARLNHTFANLSACTTYRLGVAWADAELENETVYAQAETAFSPPDQVVDLTAAPSKPGALQISWNMSDSVGRCVKYYRLAIDSETGHSVSAVTNCTNHTFEELHACTVYHVTVTPVDRNDTDGPPSRLECPSTLSEVSAKPVLAVERNESTSVTKNSIALVWLLEDKRNNCTLLNVTSECIYTRSEGSGYELLNGTATADLPPERPDNVTVEVRDLSPYTEYACRARGISADGESPWSEPVSLATLEDAPSAPVDFQSIGRLANNLLTFTWLPPKYRPGRLAGYRIDFDWQPSYPVPEACRVDHTYQLDEIDPELSTAALDREEACARYRARIAARTAAGYSPEAEIEFSSASGGVPTNATELRCRWRRRDGNPRALDTVLDWALPCLSRGLLYQFEVTAVGTRAPGYENHTLGGEVNVPADYGREQRFDLNFGELRPLYSYEFRVVATIRGGSAEPGEPATCRIDYPAGLPQQPGPDYVRSIRLDPHKARRTTTSAAVLLPLFPDDNGQIRYYAVMVSGRTFDNSSARLEVAKEGWPNVSSWKEAMEADFDIAYQATEPKWQPLPSHIVDYGHMKAAKFVIGEDATCPEVSSNSPTRSYCNGPLKPGSWYEVRMRAFTDQGYADSVAFKIKTNAELNLVLVLGVIFGILFIGIASTLMLLVKRSSFRLLVQRIAQSSVPESPVPQPLTRRKFVNHCQQLADDPEKLGNEFKLLQTLSIDLQMPSNAACLQANRKKNRYSDILPYDFSRVKLEIIDNDPNTDYINASFIRGYSSNEEYIACQGPKEETSHDFWRMIDQYDVKMIVMLTQLVERGREKCFRYFPALRETFNYETLSIKCTSELDYRTYTHRTLLLQKDNKRRSISHLHFKDWPDHDVPDDFEAMIQFCQMFRKQMSSVKGLSVIHCSAGIGRTGTLISIDILLQAIRDNRKLDVFGTVYRLRRHRLNMVQRESQYAYIYSCIRQVLKNPYFLKSFRKNSLSMSIDSLQPLCQSSPQTTPKIPMNVLFAGLRYCKSTSAIDTRSPLSRIGRYNSEGYAICSSGVDSPSTSSKESTEEMNELDSMSGSLYENVEPLIRASSSQTIAGSDYYLTNDSTEKDTSL